MGAKKYLKPLTGEQLAQGEPVIIEVNGEKITYMFPKARITCPFCGYLGKIGTVDKHYISGNGACPTTIEKTTEEKTPETPKKRPRPQPAKKPTTKKSSTVSEPKKRRVSSRRTTQRRTTKYSK